jgi:membrane carboxypeptidase/penicillin-binding protein
MVRALVGGYDFATSQYNRALQAKRQPGSSFKPIIYSAALESGLSELSVVQDGPLSFRLAGGKLWQPQNYDNKFHGPVTLRSALAHSLNSVSVRLVQRVGGRAHDQTGAQARHRVAVGKKSLAGARHAVGHAARDGCARSVSSPPAEISPIRCSS